MKGPFEIDKQYGWLDLMEDPVGLHKKIDKDLLEGRTVHLGIMMYDIPVTIAGGVKAIANNHKHAAISVVLHPGPNYFDRGGG